MPLSWCADGVRLLVLSGGSSTAVMQRGSGREGGREGAGKGGFGWVQWQVGGSRAALVCRDEARPGPGAAIYHCN